MDQQNPTLEEYKIHFLSHYPNHPVKTIPRDEHKLAWQFSDYEDMPPSSIDIQQSNSTGSTLSYGYTIQDVCLVQFEELPGYFAFLHLFSIEPSSDLNEEPLESKDDEYSRLYWENQTVNLGTKCNDYGIGGILYALPSDYCVAEVEYMIANEQTDEIMEMIKQTVGTGKVTIVLTISTSEEEGKEEDRDDDWSWYYDNEE